MDVKTTTVLSSGTYTTLRQVAGTDNPDNIKEINREDTRTLLHIQYKVVHQRIMEQMEVENLEPLETEDDILSAAVALTR